LENLAKTEQNAYDGARFFAAKTCRENQYTIYDVSYAADGKVTLSNPVYIDASAIGRTSVRDFAWDFGNNLYVASYYGYGLYAFALPNKGDSVSTPCRDVYEYKMAPVHEFLTHVNPTVDGADTYASIIHVRIGQAPYQDYLQNAKMDLRADVLNGCKFYQWTTYGWDNSNQVLRTYPVTTGNKFLVDALTEKLDVTAEIGICAYEDVVPLEVKAATTFPAAFVKRDLDTESYSTICFPFDIKELTDELQGASVLKLDNITPEGDDQINFNFTEVTFEGNDIIQAGVPYLIKPLNNISGEFTLNQSVKCPVTTEFNNGYGAKDVTVSNNNISVTFHGIMKTTTFPASENNLFLLADDRLGVLTKQGSVKGMRGFFTITGANLSKIQCKIQTKANVATSLPNASLLDSIQTTKYIWNGQIYIKCGNQVYNLSGARVK
jgi:hypothetical protein